MTKNDAIVAVYRSHQEAELAIKELQQAGFDMKQLSIVGKETHTEELAKAKDIMHTGNLVAAN